MVRINRLRLTFVAKHEKVKQRKDEEASVWCANGMERERERERG